MKSPLSGAECSLLTTIEVEHIRRRWLEAMNIVWDPKSSSQRINYWLDPKSGFAFYTPTDLAGEAPLYEQLQEFDWYYMPDKWEFRQALAWIQDPKQCSSLPTSGGECARPQSSLTASTLLQTRDFSYQALKKMALPARQPIAQLETLTA